MDCNLPGSSVHGILQARILECLHFLLQGIFLSQGLNPGLQFVGAFFTTARPGKLLKLSYSTGPPIASSFSCSQTEPRKLHIPQT